MAFNLDHAQRLLRYFPGLGNRVFEPSDNTVQYVSQRQTSDFLGAEYGYGETLPFDEGDHYSETAMTVLGRYWDYALIASAS